MEVKNLKQTRAIETSYGEMNAWQEWIKYSVHTLNKSDCYTCATGRLEPQVVSFSLGWPTDTARMACMVASSRNGQPRAVGLSGPCHYYFL
jgi:hypothetical protein